MHTYHFITDWVLQQGSVLNTTSNGQAAVALTLTEEGGGSLLSSTRYIHYGRVTARCTFTPPFSPSHLTRFLVKTGRWAGVVTAFITMSSIKDEIDWEFPGNQTTEAQTNYFWQGNIRRLAKHHLLSVYT